MAAGDPPADRLPRLVVAGTGGDSGKTLVSLGLVMSWRDGGHVVRPFKKGPDYIDAAWLEWASGEPARNLDTYLMGVDEVRQAFVDHATAQGFNLVEGNRGLYDGMGADGVHSTAALARHLAAPILLVVDCAKRTRSTAAVVLGFQAMEPDAPLGGVVLNRVAGARHERVVRQAIAATCDLPVVGSIPALRGGDPLPGRHLGLVTVHEHGALSQVRGRLVEVMCDAIDWEAVEGMARGAPPLAGGPARTARRARGAVTIGVMRDSAFTFYYPDNLEALERAGARLVFISSMEDRRLPEMDALYIGGGFPETHAERLSRNGELLAAVAVRALDGMPIYAECGGLMVLAESIRIGGRSHAMAGVLPVAVDVRARPQGHGYCEVVVDSPNPLFDEGTRLRGHEFHYSRLVSGRGRVRTSYRLERGTGSHAGRDGIVVGNVLASYVHLHARGTPAWAPGLVRAAERWRMGEGAPPAIRGVGEPET